MLTKIVLPGFRAPRPISWRLRAITIRTALVVGAVITPPALLAQDSATVILEVFVQHGCPHCARAESFLARVLEAHPHIELRLYDVAADRVALQRLIGLAQRWNISPVGVPAFYVRDSLIVGYLDDQTTGRQLLSLLGIQPQRTDAPDTTRALSPVVPEAEQSPDAPGPDDVDRGSDAIDVPLFGSLSLNRLGLPAFTIAIGLVDGLNPCAMWALLYLLSLLVNMHDRRRMLIVAGTFVAIGGLVYFAFIAAWFEAFMLIGFSRTLQAVLGSLAILAGIVNMKDFVAFKRGISLSIPESAKPTIYARIRRVMIAENLVGAVMAVAILAALINLVELLCTAGLPAVYTQILSTQDLTRAQYYGYLGLYIGAYIFDDSLILGVAVVTLSQEKLQERGGRVLKLLSGAVMVILGFLLLFMPHVLQ